jgi:hypothetical protein
MDKLVKRDIQTISKMYHTVTYYQYHLHLIDISMKERTISITLCKKCGNYIQLWVQHELSPHALCKCTLKMSS